MANNSRAAGGDIGSNNSTYNYKEHYLTGACKTHSMNIRDNNFMNLHLFAAE